MSTLVAPQMVINSRMLYFGWIPADPAAVRAMAPKGLTAMDTGQVFMNQYIVDSEDQTNGFGAYSLTYIGPDLEGVPAPDGETPGRWWTHYFNSSPGMIDYASERGVPASTGTTTLELSGDKLVVTTASDGVPVIRTTAKVGKPAMVARGQLRYFTEVGGSLVSGIYPYVADVVDPWEVTKVEFLEPDHSVYALRPADPLQIVWGFYSPSASFAYPGGEEAL